MKNRTLEFKGTLIIDDPIRFAKQTYDLKEYFRRRKHKERVIRSYLTFSTTIKKRISMGGPVINIVSRPVWKTYES